MNQKRKCIFKDVRGQGMTEYVIIVALVAVIGIAAVRLFGNTVRVMFGQAIAQMQGITYSGEDYSDFDSIKDITKKKDLKNFGED